MYCLSIYVIVTASTYAMSGAKVGKKWRGKKSYPFGIVMNSSAKLEREIIIVLKAA
jgi:hypothetical protein